MVMVPLASTKTATKYLKGTLGYAVPYFGRDCFLGGGAPYPLVSVKAETINQSAGGDVNGLNCFRTGLSALEGFDINPGSGTTFVEAYGVFDGVNYMVISDSQIVNGSFDPANDNKFAYSINGAPIVTNTVSLAAITNPIQGFIFVQKYPSRLPGLELVDLVGRRWGATSVEVYAQEIGSAGGALYNFAKYDDLSEFNAIAFKTNTMVLNDGVDYYVFNVDTLLAPSPPSLTVVNLQPYLQGGAFSNINYDIILDDPTLANGSFTVSGANSTMCFYTGLDSLGNAVALGIDLNGATYTVYYFSGEIPVGFMMDDLGNYWGKNATNYIFVQEITNPADAFLNAPIPPVQGLACQNFCLPMYKTKGAN